MTKHLNDRLREDDPELIRLDISPKYLHGYDEWRKSDFLHALGHNMTVETVHLSCADLEDCFTHEQIEQLFEAVGKLQNMTELFIFRGDCPAATEALVAKCLAAAIKVTVLMLWDFGTMGDNPILAGAIRSHPALERLTLTLPAHLPYAYLDVYIMGFAVMKTLKCLSIRCSRPQPEAAISPEAMGILLSSAAIKNLYLTNLGLTDDHTDAITAELPSNDTLELLDLKDNFFTDDALYSFAAALKKNNTLSSLDLTGVQITAGGGQALADAMPFNTVLTNLELEGGAERYADEFDIPASAHAEQPWMKALYFQIRLNRAHTGSLKNRKLFVEAVNSVSDHLGCLYYFIRGHPAHCEKMKHNLPYYPTESAKFQNALLN
jgi:hypothetical protein